MQGSATSDTQMAWPRLAFWELTYHGCARRNLSIVQLVSPPVLSSAILYLKDAKFIYYYSICHRPCQKASSYRLLAHLQPCRTLWDWYTMLPWRNAQLKWSLNRFSGYSGLLASNFMCRRRIRDCLNLLPLGLHILLLLESSAATGSGTTPFNNFYHMLSHVITCSSYFTSGLALESDLDAEVWEAQDHGKGVPPPVRVARRPYSTEPVPVSSCSDRAPKQT